MFHNISLKVGNWDCCTRFFGHHLFFQINFVFLPSFILPSSSFPHIFCPQILPLPLPSGLPSFSGQNRGQGQGQNLRAKYMGRWRRGQKRGQNQKLLECPIWFILYSEIEQGAKCDSCAFPDRISFPFRAVMSLVWIEKSLPLPLVLSQSLMED